MYGIFLINSERHLAFAQFGAHVEIQAFRYVADARILIACHSDGQEELFTAEQPQPMIDCLERAREVHVAHINDGGLIIKEYSVLIERSQ